MTLVLAILPLAFTMLVGYALVRFDWLPREQWQGIETLTFRLLIPVVLIHAIAVSELSATTFAPTLAAIVLASAIAATFVFLCRFLFSNEQLPNPRFTTVFQTTTRWNAFITLAAVDIYIGPNALSAVAFCILIMVPLINVVNIVVLSAYGPETRTPRQVIMTMVQNPLIQGCAIGLAIRLLPFEMPAAFIDTLELIGRATLGMCLLSIGAGMQLKRLANTSPALWAAVVSRLLIAPLLFLLLGALLGFSQQNLLIGVLVLSVPAATNGYILARKMGGDAELYADVLVWQTLLAMLVIPLGVYLVTQLFA